jgi:diguanylate cyclase (GGDEF)-like protein/putative nucleotidyltransferase with HDIG domain
MRSDHRPECRKTMRSPSTGLAEAPAVSYRRQSIRYCILFLILLAIGAVCISAPVLLPGTSERGEWMRSIGSLALGVSLVPVLGLAVVLTHRMRRDLERLQQGIDRLSDPEQASVTEPFQFAEFNACAQKLKEVSGKLNARQEQLNDGASRDALTGLPNRRTMKYVMSREVAFAERTGWPLSVVMADLDHFKQLNDTYGHQAGDFVLERTARRLDSLVRNSDVVARYGGEEFMLILPGTGLEQAVEVAQQLRNALRCDRMRFENCDITVTASFGVAELHSCAASDADMLVSKADAALYAAKDQGRDRVVAASVSTPDRQVEAPTPPTASTSSEANNADDPIDRDTMSLMGSIFSILQLMPDRYRVACDLAQQVAAVAHAHRAVLYLHDPGRGQLVPLASSRIEERDRLVAIETPAELSAWFHEQRQIGDTPKARNLDTVEVCPPTDDDEIPKLRIGLVSFGELIGVIVSDLEPSEQGISDRQRTVLSALSTIGATALRTCGTYLQQEDRWVGLIEALARAIHSVDAFQRKHARRVADIAVVLARALGQQDRDELQMIRVAGLVHDIGKIGLPKTLFTKKGRLRGTERAQMQEHCKLGADILDTAPDLQRLAKVVLHHHEHYDGGGYPDGLAGSEIPIESRIIAVADAYDAMTNERPFRAALSHDEAIRRLRAASVSQFDPAVVGMFVELFEHAAHRDLLLEASFHDVANWTPNRKTPSVAENSSLTETANG